MSRPDRPYEMEFFATPRAAHGDRAICFAFGEVVLSLNGIGAVLHDWLDERYGPFVRAGSLPRSALRVDVFADDTDYYIPPRPGEFNQVFVSCDGTRVRMLGYCAAGWFDTSSRRGQLVLAHGEFDPAERSTENYVRAAVAWLAAARGGALVHAASAARNGTGYLFYGESGAGKSTLAACNRTAHIVSDDLSLVLPGANGGLELVGTPFRGTYEEGDPYVGRCRLAAGFRIVQDLRAEVRRVPRVQALAELVGNLPFVAEAFGRRPDLFEDVDRAFQDVPLAHLHFRKDDSYWKAIDDAGL